MKIQINNSAVHKATGPDGISPKLLKLAGQSVTAPLTVIFNQSLRETSVPSTWKCARIKTTHKKGDITERENYRPLSILSVPSKIMEKCVVDKLVEHTSVNNNLVNSSQWTYKKELSTELLLVNMTEKWRSALDQRKTLCAVFIDFRKAFDSVSLTNLPYKVQAHGIMGNMWKWLTDCLSNCTQFTTVGESMSQTSPVTCGVPQGSVLGPFLFNLYTDDLPNVINTLENTCIEMYADDTILYCIADDVDTAIAVTNKALALIAEWCIMNDMVLHPVKCEAMLLHRSVFIGPMQALTINNVVIKVVKSTNAIVSNIKNTANKTLGFIKRNLHSCPEGIKSRAYISLVRPTIEYASTVWDPCRQYQIQWLENVQRRAARFATRTYGSEQGCVTRFLNHLQWLSLQHRRKVARLTLLHKALHSEAAVNIPLYIEHKPTMKTRRSHSLKFIPLHTRCDKY